MQETPSNLRILEDIACARTPESGLYEEVGYRSPVLDARRSMLYVVPLSCVGHNGVAAKNTISFEAL